MAEVGREICEVFRREEAQATALETVSRSRDELELVLAAHPRRHHACFNRQGAHHLRERRRRARDRIRLRRRPDARPSPTTMVSRASRCGTRRGGRCRPRIAQRARVSGAAQRSKLLRYRTPRRPPRSLGVVEAVPILDEHREVHRVVHVIHDVTNQQRIEQENVRLVGEAQEALRAREDLLAIVSHDLRNPLGVVLASSALLLKSNLPPDKQERARRQVEAIQRAGNRMNRLIRDLLDFASIQAGRLSVSVRPQDVGAMVTEVLEVMEPLAAAKSLRLTTDVAPDLAIRCDHDRVIQLFSNLVGNAVKFTGRRRHDHGARRGRWRRRAVLRRSTPAPASRPTELPHVFDRYYQAQRTEPRRDRPGPVDRARHRRGARRPHLGRERGGPGEHVFLHARARAAGRGRTGLRSRKSTQDSTQVDAS